MREQFNQRAEPVIGHIKVEHRMERLHHQTGDANNTILADAGYNLRLLIRWPNSFIVFLLWRSFPPAKFSPA